jgi:hypothetical protein
MQVFIVLNMSICQHLPGASDVRLCYGLVRLFSYSRELECSWIYFYLHTEDLIHLNQTITLNPGI